MGTADGHFPTRAVVTSLSRYEDLSAYSGPGIMCGIYLH